MRLIDADALIVNFCEKPNYSYSMFVKIRSRINAAPAINAVPVVHGRWEFRAGVPICTVCGEEPYRADDNHMPTFCPSCGARMDAEEAQREQG